MENWENREEDWPSELGDCCWDCCLEYADKGREPADSICSELCLEDCCCEDILYEMGFDEEYWEEEIEREEVE
jgi:hypothetical protein